MKVKSVALTFLVFLVLYIVFPIIVIKINNSFSLPGYNYPVLKVIGIMFIVLGVLPGLYSFIVFRTIGKGTPIPIEPAKRIVTQGL